MTGGKTGLTCFAKLEDRPGKSLLDPSAFGGLAGPPSSDARGRGWGDWECPTLADMFAQMDYMERKGSGLALMLDAYAKEAPNPHNLEPKFFSSSGSFHVV